MIPFLIILNIKFNEQKPIKSSHKASAVKAPVSGESPMILEPSMQFVQSLPSSTANDPSPIPQKVVAKVVIPPKIISPVTASQIKPLTQSTPVAPSALQPSSPKKPSTINRDTATFNIHEIEDRFQNNSNPHLGLYIARYHYDHGNYSEAYNYALKTNAINNTIEESWLIFAKSMVKLGKSDQAKKTLQLYISQSNSDSAKNLLETLEKGESK